MAIDRVKDIQNIINEQSDINGLFRISQKLGIPVPMNEIKTIFKEFVENFSADDARRKYYLTESLEKILGDDIIQYIEMFVHCKSNHLVSKTFEKIYKKNNRILYKKKRRIASEYSVKFPFIRWNDDIPGTIWIVMAVCRPWTQDQDIKEVRSQYSMSRIIFTNNLVRAAERAKSGDLIYLQSGRHSICDVDLIRQHIEIIGLGDGGAEVHSYGKIRLKKNARVIFQNIKFVFRWIKGNFQVGEESHLWIWDCKISGITMRCLIDIGEGNCQLHMLRTKLRGNNGIDVWAKNGNISVVDCVFNIREYACVMRGGHICLAGNEFASGSCCRARSIATFKNIGNVMADRAR